MPASTLLYPDEANYPPGSYAWYRVRQSRLQREGRVGGIADVAADIARKERVELYLKIAAVGVAGIGAVGLLVYALRS
jgi:hypothetical protein